jgi:hypothetical protein
LRPRIAFLLSALALTNCSGDNTGPSDPAYFIALQDRPCDTSLGSIDTLSQPGGVAPNAGSGFIDSTSGPRPPFTVLWVVGTSTVYSSISGDLTFVLLRVRNPPPVGVYPVGSVADSTVFLESYSAPWAARPVPFDMSEVGFVTAPFTGTITIEESDATGVVGRFDLAEGQYLFDGGLRCMAASGRFSSRER